MTKSIIPIGRALGWTYSDAGQPESFEWFRGDDILDLGGRESAALALAFEDHKKHFELRFDRNAYLELLLDRSDGISEKELSALVAELITKGLLIEVDLSSDQLEPIFAAYRIIPTTRSYGSSKDEPSQFSIGHEQPSIFFSGWCRTIWAASHTAGSIWRGCELIAENLPNHGASEVARDFAKMLPVIVATESGYLEKI